MRRYGGDGNNERENVYGANVRGGFYTWTYERSMGMVSRNGKAVGKTKDERDLAWKEGGTQDSEGCYEHPSSKLCFGNGVL